MRKICFVLLSATIIMVSCSKKKDSTTPSSTSTTSSTTSTGNERPTACFTSPKLVEIINGTTETLNLSAGCSQLAYSYDWDYGDGSPHDNTRDVQHAYRKAGKFYIRLKVYNQNKTVADSLKSTITVGERYITKITINSIAATDPVTGFAWDHSATGGVINGVNDTIGPDLFLTLGLDATTGTDILSTDTLDGTALGTVFNNVTINASGAITPAGSVTWDLKKYNRQVKAASVDWDMQVWDVNYTASGSSKRNISNFFKFNPIITLGTTSPSSVPLGGGPWKVTFEWEVR